MSLVSWTQCLCHPTDPLGHVYLLPWDLGSCLASWEHLYPPSCACCCCHPHRSMSPQHGSPGRPLEGQGTPRGIEGPPPPDTRPSLLRYDSLLQEAEVCRPSLEIPRARSGADGEAPAGAGRPPLTLLLFSVSASLAPTSASGMRLLPKHYA